MFQCECSIIVPKNQPDIVFALVFISVNSPLNTTLNVCGIRVGLQLASVIITQASLTKFDKPYINLVSEISLFAIYSSDWTYL